MSNLGELYEKILILLLLSIFLVACSITTAAGTPEKSLEKFYTKENIKVITVLDTDYDNHKQGFYVIEGEVDNETKWFVANIVSNDLYWYVKEAIDIGIPNIENEAESSGTTFNAGFSIKTEKKKNSRINVDIPESDYYVWIKPIKNEK